MFLRYVLFCLLIISYLGISQSYAQDKAITDQLAELKVKNDLAEWLYVRIDQANSDAKLHTDLYHITKETWRKPANMAEHVAWLTLLSNMGFDRLQAGDVLNSINYYEEAYTYFRKYKATEFDIVAYVLKPLGNNYTRLGDYERAIFIQQKIIGILDPVNDADEIASNYSNIAISYYNMGNYVAARRSIDKGMALVKDRTVITGLTNTLADILYQQDSLKHAEALILKNITLQKVTGKQSAHWLMSSHTTLGNIRLKTGQRASAKQSFDKALQLGRRFYPTERQREKAYITTQLAKIERQAGHPKPAMALLNTSLQILQINSLSGRTDLSRIYGENKLVEIFREKAAIYQQRKQPEQALQQLRFALLANDKIRAEFADDRTKERLQQENKQLAEDAIELAYQLSLSASDQKKYLLLILEISEQCRARTLADQVQRNNVRSTAKGNDTLQQKRAALERSIVHNQRLLLTEKDTATYQKKIATLKFDLSLLDQQSKNINAASVLSSLPLLKTLPADLHSVEYFIGRRSAYSIVVQNGRVSAINKISSVDSLKSNVSKLVETYYRKGADAALNSPKVFYQLSHQVYTDLLSSITLKTGQKLCIIPDDVLGYLSFDGLITNEKYDPAISQWPYLIHKAIISYAFSLNALAKNKTYDRAVANTNFTGLFITHEKANDKPILAVKKEAGAISKWVGGNFLYDDQVDSKSFFNAFDNSSALHISTHAYLSGANQEPTLDLGKQQLFLFELLATKNKPQLVVLSACRTGDGLMAGGEGIISLSRGFSAIGTPATIAGLWNVNDDAAATITANAYKGLANGLSSAEALHQAKLNWLNSMQNADAMYLPYYWDSLILMGADERVSLYTDESDIWLCSSAGALVLLTTFLTLRKIWLKKRRR